MLFPQLCKCQVFCWCFYEQLQICSASLYTCYATRWARSHQWQRPLRSLIGILCTAPCQVIKVYYFSSRSRITCLPFRRACSCESLRLTFFHRWAETQQLTVLHLITVSYYFCISSPRLPPGFTHSTDLKWGADTSALLHRIKLMGKKKDRIENSFDVDV